MSTSTFRIRPANFFAKRSLSAWQPNRVIRKVCRKSYRFLMETGTKEYPYADLRFAPWPESDDLDNYTLVTDSNNNVIRRSTSYIAWMIKKHYGSWPRKPIPGERKPGEHAFDAKHWDEVLAFNGWDRIPDGFWPLWPREGTVETYHYIGILPDEGEFGQLLWLDGIDPGPYTWVVSTYKDFRKEEISIPISDKSGVVWYKKTKV